MLHARNLALVYARNDLETGVAAADPHRLVLMLFDGAIRAIDDGAQHLANGDYLAKGMALAKAVQIVEDGLLASLDRNSGGGMADQLAALYDYIALRVATGSLRNDGTCLDEARTLLAQLRAAWSAIEARSLATALADSRVALGA
jgi:flagellar protein FliS